MIDDKWIVNNEAMKKITAILANIVYTTILLNTFSHLLVFSSQMLQI